jgi:EAL domain-containing protein (putative c-di-GMP-specific phosphodiesterase class I)
MATRNRSFKLRYQPAVNLQTWQFECAETMVRWDHPQNGEIPLERFRPVAEENGWMGEISQWALANACQQLSQWSYESPADSPRRVSLDVSRKQLLHPGFLDAALETIHQARLRNDRVQFEVAETELMREPIGIVDAKKRLRESGVRIIIDDFGTSFPSVHYLEHFPVDGIKLNRNLVRDLESNAFMPKLMEMIVRHASTLNLTVTVDGVESESQVKTLSDLGYRWAQGTFFSEPIAGDAMIPFLMGWNTKVRGKSRVKSNSRDTSGSLSTSL